MADIDFVHTWVSGARDSQIKRAAVLHPLARQVCRGPTSVRYWSGRVVVYWRARLLRLRDVGWVCSDSTKRQQYVRNCRPAFTGVSHPTRFCGLRFICPFCYARWVRDVWLKIDAAFPSLPEPQAQLPDSGERSREILIDPVPQQGLSTCNSMSVISAYHLIERRVTSRYDYEPDMARQAATLMDRAIVGRQKRLRLLKPTGAFTHITLDPGRSGWRVRSRELYMVPANYVFPDEMVPAANSQLLRHTQPTRKVLFGAVSRTCRYPVGMLFGDAHAVVALIQARRNPREFGLTPARLRLSESFGVFRSRGSTAVR